MAADIDKPLSARQINVLVAIDTVDIKRVYGPNQNAAQPQPVAHEAVFVISAGSRAALRTQARDTLRLQAQVGARVTMHVTSICGNASDAVIAYRIGQTSGTPLFDRFQQAVFTRTGAVRPDPDSPSCNGLPPIERAADFSNFNSIVTARGAGKLEIAFALYALSSNRQQQQLFGCYECEINAFSV